MAKSNEILILIKQRQYIVKLFKNGEDVTFDNFDDAIAFAIKNS